jgi:hypothetical protein
LRMFTGSPYYDLGPDDQYVVHSSTAVTIPLSSLDEGQGDPHTS